MVVFYQNGSILWMFCQSFSDHFRPRQLVHAFQVAALNFIGQQSTHSNVTNVGWTSIYIYINGHLLLFKLFRHADYLKWQIRETVITGLKDSLFALVLTVRKFLLNVKVAPEGKTVVIYVNSFDVKILSYTEIVTPNISNCTSVNA